MIYVFQIYMTVTLVHCAYSTLVLLVIINIPLLLRHEKVSSQITVRYPLC